MDKDIWKTGLAEFFGTFCLVFIGAGSVCAGSGLVGVALAHGLALMAMVYTFGYISGAHVNPAVTIALMSQRKMSVEKGLSYIVFQLAGAVIAGLCLRLIFPGQLEGLALGTPDLASGMTQGIGLLLEAILTFFLVLVIFGTAVDSRGQKSTAGLAIGLVLTFDILVGGNLTGGAMNPARTFGPAIASHHFANHWVYWLGPILGGLLAAYVYSLLFSEKSA